MLHGGRKERLAHERLLDERDHVRERRPARRARRALELVADLPPGRLAVAAVAHRVGGAQQRRDGLAHGVMDDQALAPQFDEWQRLQPCECVPRVIREQRRQQRERDTAQDRRRVQDRARRRVEPVEVERREFLHDGRQDRVLRGVRALAQRRRRQLQRERMPAHEAVDPLGLGLVEPGPAEHFGRVGERQRPERHGKQQLAERRPPDGAGRVARGQDHAGMSGQRRQERLTQPPVQQPQALGGVDHENVGVVARGGPESLRRRLDRPAVDGHHARAARHRLRPEGPQERGLARAGDAVHDGHERPVVVEELAQRGELLVAADERAAPLGEQRAERHATWTGSGSGAATTVDFTSLIPSSGSISASAWRASISRLVAS